MIEQKAFRGYNIDIEPNYFFGSSITCEMLKDAEMDKYMDFRLVNNMLHYDGKSLKNVRKCGTAEFFGRGCFR